MNRPDAPPLKIVVDDGAHIAEHMAQTVFFWFPRIQPRGVLIAEVNLLSSRESVSSLFCIHSSHFIKLLLCGLIHYSYV